MRIRKPAKVVARFQKFRCETCNKIIERIVVCKTGKKKRFCEECLYKKQRYYKRMKARERKC